MRCGLYEVIVNKFEFQRFAWKIKINRDKRIAANSTMQVNPVFSVSNLYYPGGQDKE